MTIEGGPRGMATIEQKGFKTRERERALFSSLLFLRCDAIKPLSGLQTAGLLGWAHLCGFLPGSLDSLQRESGDFRVVTIGTKNPGPPGRGKPPTYAHAEISSPNHGLPARSSHNGRILFDNAIRTQQEVDNPRIGLNIPRARVQRKVHQM